MGCIIKYIGIGACVGVGYLAACTAMMPIMQKMTYRMTMKNIERMCKD